VYVCTLCYGDPVISVTSTPLGDDDDGRKFIGNNSFPILTHKSHLYLTNIPNTEMSDIACEVLRNTMCPIVCKCINATTLLKC